MCLIKDKLVGVLQDPPALAPSNATKVHELDPVRISQQLLSRQTMARLIAEDTLYDLESINICFVLYSELLFQPAGRPRPICVLAALCHCAVLVQPACISFGPILAQPAWEAALWWVRARSFRLRCVRYMVLGRRGRLPLVRERKA